MINKVENPKIKLFLETYKRYADLLEISSLLSWDAEVMMPENGGERRGKLSAFVDAEAHNTIVSKEFEERLLECEKESNLNQTEKAIIRESNRILKVNKKLPVEFVKEYSEHRVKSTLSWRKAKSENNFKLFQDDLKKMYELTIKYAELKGYEKHPYNALLDDYEIGLDINLIDKVFSKLVPATKEILTNLKEQEIKKELIDGSKYIYSEEAQLKIGKLISNKLGLKPNESRLDPSAHPFSQEFNLDDVRITTRCNKFDPLYSITSTAHEVGHALYMNGVNRDLEGTPVGGTNAVLGLHESQSRTWENFVGRSMEFCEFLFPILESHFPWLSDYQVEDLYNLLNYVNPSLIRTEADQVTYNMHIALRYEIEVKLIEGKIKVEELPEYWDSKMEEYLGVKPKSVVEGVLQDIHWSNGLIGYFPTYTLGNVYAAQIFEKFKTEYPNYANEFRFGRFSTLRSWLKDNLHQYGQLFEPKEIFKNITGQETDPEYLVNYLKSKYCK